MVSRQNANSDIVRTTFRSEGNYGCIPRQGLGPQYTVQWRRFASVLIERGRQQNAKLVVVGRILCALKETFLLSFFNAEKYVFLKTLTIVRKADSEAQEEGAKWVSRPAANNNKKAVLSERWPRDAPTKVNKQPHLHLRSRDSRLTQFNQTLWT